jgi:iron complex outermembrane receptor protein
MKRFTKSAVLGATALAAGLVTAGAQAQVDVITVTAQQREKTLQDTPVAVSAVTGGTLEIAQIRDARDLQTLVPSLSVNTAASATNTTFSIRSIGTDTFNPGLESSVGIFVDGVFLARQGAAIGDFLSLERVEVLRGPQSTLFGRNSPAGVVSFITRAPEFEFGGEGELTVSNFDGFIARGTVTGPIIEDSLAFRIDANYNRRDGFVDNVVDDRDFNNRDRWSLRGQLLWEGENTTVRIIGDYSEIDERCCAGPFMFHTPTTQFVIPALGGTLLPPDPFNFEIAVNNDVFTNTEHWGFSGQIDHDFGPFTFTSITAIRDYEEFQNIDADFTDIDLAGDRLINQRYDTFTQEFRLTSNGGGRLDWLLGAYYYNNTLRHNNQTPFGADLRNFADLATLDTGGNLPAPFTGGSTVAFVEALCNGFAGPVPSGCVPGVYFAQGDGLREEDYLLDTTSWALFGQFDFHLTDRFTVTLGGRYTNEDKDIIANVDINDPFAAINFVAFGGDIIFQQLFQPTFGVAPTPANIGFIAANFPAQFAAFQQGVAAAAADPSTNPFLALTPLQFNPPSTGFTASRSEDNFSGNIILAFDLTDNINVYGSYTRGFKPGGFNVSANAALTGVFEFEEETIDAWELGVKGLVFNNTTSFAAALFRQNLNDFQANIFTGTGFGLQNAGEVQITGLEFEFQSQPTDRLLLTGGFTWAWDSKFVSFTRNACPPVPGMFPGLLAPGIFATPEDVPEGQCGRSINPVSGLPITTQNSSGQDRQTPELVASLTGMYTQPINERLEAFIRAEYYHIGERSLAGNLNPLRVEDATNIINGSIGLASPEGNWMLQLWARNLFNEKYLQGNFESVGQPGSLNGYPGDPRTYGLTLRARF